MTKWTTARLRYRQQCHLFCLLRQKGAEMARRGQRTIHQDAFGESGRDVVSVLQSVSSCRQISKHEILPLVRPAALFPIKCSADPRGVARKPGRDVLALSHSTRGCAHDPCASLSMPWHIRPFGRQKRGRRDSRMHVAALRRTFRHFVVINQSSRR